MKTINIKVSDTKNSMGLTEEQMCKLYPLAYDDSPNLIRLRNPHLHWFQNGLCKICNLVQGIED